MRLSKFSTSNWYRFLCTVKLLVGLFVNMGTCNSHVIPCLCNLALDILNFLLIGWQMRKFMDIKVILCLIPQEYYQHLRSSFHLKNITLKHYIVVGSHLSCERDIAPCLVKIQSFAGETGLTSPRHMPVWRYMEAMCCPN